VTLPAGDNRSHSKFDFSAAAWSNQLPPVGCVEGDRETEKDDELSSGLFKAASHGGAGVLVCCGTFVAALIAATAQTGPYDRLYVFGDSYSDIGEGYLDGNGATAVAYLAERLDISLTPANDAALGKSLDFAISGAGTGKGSGSRVGGALLGVGMQNQVEDFAGRVHSRAIVFKPEKTLFFLAGGLNDSRLPAGETVGNLQSEIRILYGLGARHFMVALLPTAIPAFSLVGLRLNPELARIPGELAAELPDARIGLSRWGLFFDDVMRNPAQYGIRNTTDACAGRAIFHEDASPCPAPEAYFYYHAGHPSTVVHKAVGEKLYKEALEFAAQRDRDIK
jgi:cholinesterase